MLWSGPLSFITDGLKRNRPPPASVDSAGVGDSEPVRAAETLAKHSSLMIRVTETWGVGDESAIKKHAQTARLRRNQ